MQLYMQFNPVIAGTSDPAGEPFTLPCPPDLEPDTVRSFLVQLLGEPADIVCTSTPRHGRLEIGWVFDALPPAETGPAAEFLCVPQVRLDDGSMRPMFEVQADQRDERAAGEDRAARRAARLDQFMKQVAAESRRHCRLRLRHHVLRVDLHRPARPGRQARHRRGRPAGSGPARCPGDLLPPAPRAGR